MCKFLSKKYQYWKFKYTILKTIWNHLKLQYGLAVWFKPNLARMCLVPAGVSINIPIIVEFEIWKQTFFFPIENWLEQDLCGTIEECLTFKWITSIIVQLLGRIWSWLGLVCLSSVWPNCICYYVAPKKGWYMLPDQVLEFWQKLNAQPVPVFIRLKQTTDIAHLKKTFTLEYKEQLQLNLFSEFLPLLLLALTSYFKLYKHNDVLW